MNETYSLNSGQAQIVSRSEVERVSKYVFYIHQQPERIRLCFNKPKLLYWCGAYIIQNMSQGIIKSVDGIPFHVRFTQELTRGYILDHLDEQFALSFREPKEEFKLIRYVLIRKS